MGIQEPGVIIDGDPVSALIAAIATSLSLRDIAVSEALDRLHTNDTTVKSFRTWAVAVFPEHTATIAVMTDDEMRNLCIPAPTP